MRSPVHGHGSAPGHCAHDGNRRVPAPPGGRRTAESASRWSRALAAAAIFALFSLPLSAQFGPGGPNRNPLPLREARTAEFTATEGTWISLDVSPDGQTIVFDLLGDLYTMPVTGGKAAPLLTGMAFDVQPRFSPDGESVSD